MKKLISKPLLAVLVLFLSPVAVVAAPATPAAAESKADDGRIRELEKRIAELEAALRELRSGRSGSAAADLSELQRRIDLLAAELEKIRLGAVAAERKPESRHGMGPAASRVYDTGRGVSIGGYGEMLYENFDAENDSGERSGKKDRLDFLRGVFYFGYKFNDRILFNSEIEYEHASTGEDGEVALEFAYLDFLLNEHANIRAGLVLVPAGFVNELHEPPIFLGARRPEIEQRLIPTTWRENGAGIFGDAGPFTYRAYLLAGFDSEGFEAEKPLRGGRQKGSKSDAQDLAFAARADYTGVPGLVIGGFYYMGESAQGRETASGDAFDGPVDLWDLHVEYRARGWDLRGLYTKGRLDEAAEINGANGLAGMEGVGESFKGWYAQAGFDLMTLRGRETRQALIPYIRYEEFNTQEEVADGFTADPANDMQVWTYGLAYRPIYNVTVKLDYTDFENEADTGIDQVSLALGYLF